MQSGGDFIGWTDRRHLRCEHERCRAVRVVPVRVLTNGTAARRFLLTNPSTTSLCGLVLTLDKRWSDEWQALASRRQRAKGPAPPAARPQGQEVQFYVGGNPFGRDPGTLTKIPPAGCWPDRPHVFRVMGSLLLRRDLFLRAIQYLPIAVGGDGRFHCPKASPRILLGPQVPSPSSQAPWTLAVQNTTRISHKTDSNSPRCLQRSTALPKSACG